MEKGWSPSEALLFHYFQNASISGFFPYTPGTGFLWAQAAQIQFAALPWGYTSTEVPLCHQAPSCCRNLLSLCRGWCNSQELLWTSIMLEQCPEQKQDCSSSATIPAWAAVFSSLCSREPFAWKPVLKSLHMVPLLPAAAGRFNRVAPGHFYRSTWVSPHYPPPSPNHQLQLSWSSLISHLPWRKWPFLCKN